MSFNDSGVHSKRQKISDVLEVNSPNCIKASGLKLFKKDGIKLNSLIRYMEQTGASEKELITSHKNSQKKYSVYEALKISMDCKLSTRSYKLLQSSVRHMTGLNVFPGYHCVLEEKDQCYPTLSALSDIEARANIKDVLNKIIER